MEADAALDPDRDAEARRHDALEQDERRLVADLAAALAALDDQAAGAPERGGPRLRERGDLDDATRLRTRANVVRADHARRGRGRSAAGRSTFVGTNPPARRRARRTLTAPTVRNPDTELAHAPARGGQRAPRDRAIATEVEHAERTRSTRRDDKAGIRPFQWSERDHVIARVDSHATSSHYRRRTVEIERFRHDSRMISVRCTRPAHT